MIFKIHPRFATGKHYFYLAFYACDVYKIAHEPLFGELR